MSIRLARPLVTRLSRALVVLILAATAILYGSSPSLAGGGYPDDDAIDCSATYGKYAWCKGGSWYSSRSYGYRNCTDYVAWKLVSLGIPVSRVSSLGNAAEWPSRAQGRAGVTVNTSPAFGAAAVNPNLAAPYGHVMFVESVNSDGTITISEYNGAGTGRYGTRTGTPAQLGITKFIHFGLSGTASPAPSGVRWSQRTDLDINGGADLIMTAQGAGGNASAYSLLSTYESFWYVGRWWDGTGYGWSGIKPLAADVNGDRRTDYVFLTDEGPNGTKAFVAMGTSSGFQAPQLWWNGIGWGYGGIKPSLADVDGNGGADLILTTQEFGNNAAAFVLLSTYEGFVPPSRWWDGTGYGWSGVTPLAGDVDGNGKSDFIFMTDEGANGVKVFVAKSSGSGFQPPQLWWNGVGWGYSGIKLALGDVDGNGGVDLVLLPQQAGGGTDAFVLLSTYESFWYVGRWWDGSQYGWTGVTPFVGDIDGNNKEDLVFMTDEGPNGVKVFVARSTGSAFQAPQMWWNGAGWGYSGIKAVLN